MYRSLGVFFLLHELGAAAAQGMAAGGTSHCNGGALLPRPWPVTTGIMFKTDEPSVDVLMLPLMPSSLI